MNKKRTIDDIVKSIFCLISEAKQLRLSHSEEHSNKSTLNIKNSNKDLKNLNQTPGIITKKKIDWKNIDFSVCKQKKEKNIIKSLDNDIDIIFREEIKKWLKKRPAWLNNQITIKTQEILKSKLKNT